MITINKNNFKRKQKKKNIYINEVIMIIEEIQL